MTILAENNQPLRDRAYLVLLPNVLADDQIRQRINYFKVKGAFVASVAGICDRRQCMGSVYGVDVWTPLDLTKVGVNVNLDFEQCSLCLKKEPLTQGLRII